MMFGTFGCKILLWSYAAIWMISSQNAVGSKSNACGYSSVNLRFRIVGGVKSQRGMWPWQIGLYKSDGAAPVFICGGALISRTWVLTAAHCFYEGGLLYENASLYLIKAGDHSLSRREGSQQEIVPEMILVYDQYKYGSTVDFDIALVKLSRKVQLNTFVRTLCLPQKDEGDLAIPKTDGIVAGWGRTRALRYGDLPKPPYLSKVLRHASFTIQRDQLCLNKTAVSYNSTMAFCAGDGKGKSSPCKGDSGGAFVREIKRGRTLQWVAVGIVSWGEGCAQRDKYGYYTRVYPFIEWIKRNIESQKPARGCVSLLGRLLKNPPKNTRVAINIRLSKARYRCREGFTLVGKEKRTCRGGRWRESKEPQCLAPCDKPATPVNGWKLGRNFRHGSTVKFSCVQGYVIVGASSIMCNDGVWDNKVPVCKVVGFNIKNPAEETRINLHSNGTLDLVFVVDISSSMRRYGLSKGLNFSKELLRIIAHSKRKTGTRIALVTFSIEAKLEFNLGDKKGSTIEKAIRVIDNVTFPSGYTSVGLALELVRNKVVPVTRRDSQRVMMFITDGQGITSRAKARARDIRRNDALTVFAIVVGRRLRWRELMDITGEKNHVILLARHRDIKGAIKKAVYWKKDYSPCGQSPVDLRARIVGGTTSTRGWWPWQVGIYKLDNKGEFLLQCAGALISRRWVLTAAQCFYERNPFVGKYRYNNQVYRYQVRAGDHNLKKIEKSEKRYIPERIHLHPDFNLRLFENDIALIKLIQPVELGKFVRTVCLPKKEEGDLAIPGKYGFVAGWGGTKPLKTGHKLPIADRFSTVLKHSAFTIQSDRLCPNRTRFPVNSTTTFCAGDGKGGNDTCIGDSGGAFVREGIREDGYRWVATGLVSWGEGCAQRNKFTYYTRLYPFTDWIKNTMDENRLTPRRRKMINGTNVIVCRQ